MPKKKSPARSARRFDSYRFTTLLLAGVVLVLLGWLLGLGRETESVELLPSAERAALEQAYDFAVDRRDSATAPLHEIKLTAQPITVALADGQETVLWSYTDTLAPAILHARVGERLRLTLVNKLPEPTTVHWHGLRIPNAEDGVPHVTQSVIESGASYTYDFVLPDAGTFWFHPHEQSSEQIGRGLYAILIVEEAAPPEFDQEWIFPLKDYRLTQTGELATDFGNLHDAVHGGRFGNFLTVGNDALPELTAVPGEQIRLRLINTSNARPYLLDLTDWNAEVIATDGGLVETPYAVDSLELHPGERYDLAVYFTGAAGAEYTLRESYYGDDAVLARVVLAGQPVPPVRPVLPAVEIPDWSVLYSAVPDQVVRLGGVGVMGGSRGGMMNSTGPAWTLNDGAYPTSHESIHLKLGQLTKLRFTNETRRIHPMHLHGDFFQVLSVGGRVPPTRGWKDTVNVPPLGYVDVALIPTNPGTWMLHCHILEHAELGMLTTVVVE